MSLRAVVSLEHLTFWHGTFLCDADAKLLCRVGTSVIFLRLPCIFYFHLLLFSNWIYDNIAKKWESIVKRPARLLDMFTGYHCSQSLIRSVFSRAKLSIKWVSVNNTCVWLTLQLADAADLCTRGLLLLSGRGDINLTRSKPGTQQLVDCYHFLTRLWHLVEAIVRQTLYCQTTLLAEIQRSLYFHELLAEYIH